MNLATFATRHFLKFITRGHQLAQFRSLLADIALPRGRRTCSSVVDDMCVCVCHREARLLVLCFRQLCSLTHNTCPIINSRRRRLPFGKGQLPSPVAVRSSSWMEITSTGSTASRGKVINPLSGRRRMMVQPSSVHDFAAKKKKSSQNRAHSLCSVY